MQILEQILGIHLFVINSRPIESDPPASSLPDDHQIRHLEHADLPAVTGRDELGIRRDWAAAAFDRGDVCIGYFDHGELVSYFWCSFSEAPMESGLWVRVPADCSYAYKALTVPSHRGRRLQQALTHENDRWLLRQGRRRNIEYIATHNFAQRAASARYGNRTVGYAGYWRRFGATWCFRSPGARRSGFEFFRR